MASSGAMGLSSWALASWGDDGLIGCVFMSILSIEMERNCVLTGETCERNLQIQAPQNSGKDWYKGHQHSPVPFSAPHASNDGQKPGPGIATRACQFLGAVSAGSMPSIPIGQVVWVVDMI